MTAASAAHLLDARVGGEELAGDVRVVVARLALADAVLHQAREAGQPGDGRIDAALEELALEHDLPLGDVAGQVGHGVRDVVGRHGEDGHLRDGAFAAVDAAGALVDATRGRCRGSRGSPCAAGISPRAVPTSRSDSQ